MAASALRRHVLSGPTMGTRWSATFYTADDVDEAALAARLQAAVDRVEQQMSTFRADSDLERLSAAPIGAWMDIPPELMRVLTAALDIGRLSGGAFDIGVRDLVEAFGFGTGGGRLDRDRVSALSGRASFEPPKTLQLDIVRGRARRLMPLRLDLSGIAKGFGVDELARTMTASFPTPSAAAFIVGIDGEMRAEGRKPDGRPFVVAQEKPDPEARDVLGLLEISGAAVATSGSYRYRVAVDGRLLSHTMDPRRGAPVENDLLSVTVIAETCMAADAWATALLVLGAREGVALAQRLNLAALFVRADGEVVATLQ